MEAIRNAKRGLLACCVAAALCGQAMAADRAAGGAEPANDLTGADLLYSYDEMFDFDIGRFLAARAPHLAPYGESISHWAGYSRISPKVLIALMEQQSGAVTRRSADALHRPFGDLSKAVGFDAQIRDVANALAMALYDKKGAIAGARGAVPLSSVNPLQIVRIQTGESDERAEAIANARFQEVYARLFDAPRKARPPSARFAPDARALLAGPAVGFLQFPFPRGQTWRMGGAHTDTGQGNYPMAALDMHNGGFWGGNQSNNWVVASAGGSFVRHSSCYAEVVHSGGWSTAYYHLMNIQYGTGASVSANTYIANPANTQAQALCNGGSSTGPHQHWTLKYNSGNYHLNQVTVSGYLINATGTSYDTNCSRFYLSKNGRNYCAGAFTNPGPF